MEPSIHIPTDNIYKFASLFGIAIFISSMLGSVYFIVRFNELATKTVLDFEALKAKESLSTVESVQKTILEKTRNVNRANSIIFPCLLGGSLGGSFFLSILGVLNWYRKVQPKQDELLNLQIEKMKREIQVLDKQLEKKDTE